MLTEADLCAGAGIESDPEEERFGNSEARLFGGMRFAVDLGRARRLTGVTPAGGGGAFLLGAGASPKPGCGAAETVAA